VGSILNGMRAMFGHCMTRVKGKCDALDGVSEELQLDPPDTADRRHIIRDLRGQC
jgi:hypothetical protein